MKILELRAENIKNLKVVELKPDGTLNLLTGKNGAGKSAVLDSIFMALTGKKIEKPIRDGEKRAEVTVDLGDYKVSRVFTEKTERLEVKGKDGASLKSPQGLLDKILGDLSFDPLDFSKMKPKEQRELLATVLGLNFSKIDTMRQEKFEERSIKNREVASLKAQLQMCSFDKSVLGKAELSVSEIVKSINAATEIQRAYEDYESTKEESEDHIHDLEATIKNREAELCDLKNELAEAIVEHERIVEPPTVPGDAIDKLEQDLENAEEINKKIASNKVYEGISTKLRAAEAEVESLESEMQGLDEMKKEDIANAEYPLPGLSLDDESVLYEGKPFSQLSTGEQIRVSTAIAIKLNPKLRVILIREGSLLDEKALAEIVKVAKDNDYQLWIEKVESGKGIGIYIENGQII